MMPPLRVPDVAGDAAAAALYVSNIRFALQATDYLQAEMAPSPILHFWSLGVEEQFYIFWPAIVLLVARGGGDAARRIGIVAGFIARRLVPPVALPHPGEPAVGVLLAPDPGLGAGPRGLPRHRGNPARTDPGAARRDPGVGRPGHGRPVRRRPEHRDAVPRCRGAPADRRQRPGDRGRLPPGPVRAGAVALDGDPALPRAGSRTRSTSGTGRCSSCRPWPST